MNYFQLLAKLDNLYDGLEGQELSSRAIVKQLNRAIPFKECKVVHVDSLSVNNNMMVSGMYEPEEDEAKETCIEIEIVFPKRRPISTFQFNTKDLDRAQWRELCVDVASVLGHEFVHMHQFRRRGYRDGRYYTSKATIADIKENQEYFGIPDEVEAYAFTTAVAMCEHFPNRKMEMEETIIYQIYASLFDLNDPVMLKLQKLTAKFYKRLERQYNVTIKQP